MPIFETSTNDPLGLWELTPQTVSFGIGDGETAAAPAEGTLFKLNLPADIGASNEAFRNLEAALKTTGTALQSVPTRLDDLSTRMHENTQQQEETGVSFDILNLPAGTGPEAELLSSLAEIEHGETGEVSFGLKEDFGGAFEAAKVQFDALMTQIDRDFLHFAWVETNISNRLIARTSVDWSGDSQTIWADGVSTGQIALHQRALSIATQTRNLRLRLFVTVTSGAAKMAGLMSTPAGAVFALPAIYQYVTNILNQTKSLQSIQPK